MATNIKKLAAELAPAYNTARDSEVEDDVSLCEWVRRQTGGTELTLRQAERLREAMEEIDAAGPVKVIIFVEGGVVQGCASNDAKLEVILVDREPRRGRRRRGRDGRRDQRREPGLHPRRVLTQIERQPCTACTGLSLTHFRNKIMKVAELQASTFTLVTNEEGGDEEVYNEWDWIADKVGESDTYWEVVGAIEEEYAGRGLAYEVPKRSTINRGLRELIKAGIVSCKK